MMKLKPLTKRATTLILLVGAVFFATASATEAAIPAWLLKKLQEIKPQPASLNPIIIPGWNKQQAQVLAETFITGKVDSVEAGLAEGAMSEVGEYKGKKTPVIIAKGNMAGNYPVGPYDLDDPKVTMVFDNNGNMLKREFLIPAGACASVEIRLAQAGVPMRPACSR
jgi:hypothetical protein